AGAGSDRFTRRGRTALELRTQLGREAMEVALALDEANVRAHRVRVDELREGDVTQLELPGDAHHVTVEALLDECAVGAEAELAAEDDVERVRGSAARLVPELDAGQLLGLAGALLVPLGDGSGHDLADLEARQRDVAMVVARDVAQEGLRQELGEPLREDDR